jgi:hypothetical protein
MKEIDLAKQKGEEDKRIKVSRLKLPFSKEEEKPEDLVVDSFGKVLGHQFFMLRNATLEGIEIPIPLILVGPSGVWVIVASSTKGVFLAEDRKWQKLDDGTRRYRDADPNLLTRAVIMSAAVEEQLIRQEVGSIDIKPILALTDPGVHVDASHPAARIVLADAIDRFAVKVARSPAILERDGVQAIVDAMGRLEEDDGIDFSKLRDEFSYMEEKPVKKSAQISPFADLGRGEPEFAGRIADRFPFSRRQWVILSVLLIVNLVILVALVLVVLFSI